jgi:predicted nucleic acid-binding protein
MPFASDNISTEPHVTKLTRDLEHILAISPEYWQQIAIEIIPAEFISTLESEFRDLQESDFYANYPFSFTDFALAKWAELTQIPVLSFDHHLLQILPNVVHFRSYTPTEVLERGITGQFLCDANVLVALVENKGERNKIRKQILHAFRKCAEMLIIPHLMATEVWGVVRDSNFGSPSHSRINSVYRSPMWVPFELGSHYC